MMIMDMPPPCGEAAWAITGESGKLIVVSRKLWRRQLFLAERAEKILDYAMRPQPVHGTCSSKAATSR
ncbi:MAG TPA: hypothetical protein VN624_13280 [Rhodanobacter sp.]|nr:hypothetical protein [Rhodanobacter sp.]